MLHDPRPYGVPVPVKEAAEIAGVSESLVRTRRRSGPLVPMVLNGRQAVSLESLLQFMAERSASRERREKERSMASSTEHSFRCYLDTSQEIARLRAQRSSLQQIADIAEEFLVISRHAPNQRLRDACRRAFDSATAQRTES